MSPRSLRTVEAARLYVYVIAEQLGRAPTARDPADVATLAAARRSVEALLGWQIIVTCAGWAIGSLLTATGLGLVVILHRPEWRVFGAVPGLLAAAVTAAVVVTPLLRLPAKVAVWRAAAPVGARRAIPTDRPAPIPIDMTAPTIRCRVRGAEATPSGATGLESRLVAPRPGPPTERMRFTVHPGRPGPVGATQGIDPEWPYVA